MADYPPILDGHADFLLSMEATDRDFLEGSEQGHVDLPRAREGNLGGIFCSVFISPVMAEMNAVGYTMKYIDDMYTLADRSEGQIRVVKTSEELDRCFEQGTFALVLHFEGAEPIGRSLRELRTWYEAGLRSLGMVHARPNIFGNGAPLGPTDPDGRWEPQIPGGEGAAISRAMRRWTLPRKRTLPYEDTGLTDIGREIVRECQLLGIVVDVSHMTDQSFWDTMGLVDRPIIASHSSVRAISDQKRNLTDDQIRAIAKNGGTIGINFHSAFLRPDRATNPDTPLEVVADHFDYIVKLVGDEHVGFGSDFDGSIPPSELNSAAKLGNLVRILQRRGYSEQRLERICNGNFRRVLREAWRKD
ncbi:MAG TPA: dipeptidase [Steroidobacteraceae bacterium]|nr:dipeptidase [Steroidobacteraceae bacterium]